MGQTIQTLVLPGLGLLVGAALQYYFGRALEVRKQLEIQRTQAYVDYFKAMALSAQQGRSKDILASAVDAKVRICIYGSPTVIKLLSSFDASGAMATSPAGISSITELVRAMRRDIGRSNAAISQQDFQNIIFGPQGPRAVADGR